MNENAKLDENTGENVLYDGPVRNLAKIFPVNVNTICTAAISSYNTVGMDHTRAVLVADNTLEEMVLDMLL